MITKDNALPLGAHVRSLSMDGATGTIVGRRWRPKNGELRAYIIKWDSNGLETIGAPDAKNYVRVEEDA